MKRRILYSLIAVALSIGLVVVGTAPAQMEATGDKVTGFGTATNDNADVTIAAPTGGGHTVIYGINATCETAAAMTITVTEDPAGTPATILDVVTASKENHVIDFGEVGLLVTGGDAVRVRLGACGVGVDGNVTVWGQTEIGS